MKKKAITSPKRSEKKSGLFGFFFLTASLVVICVLLAVTNFDSTATIDGNKPSTKVAMIADKNEWHFFEMYLDWYTNSPDSDFYKQEPTKEELEYQRQVIFANAIPASEQTVQLVETIKERLRGTLGSYQQLDWNNLDNLDIMEYDNPDFMACANYEPGAIYIQTSTFQYYPQDRLEQIIAHELVHALFNLEIDNTSQLTEGAVDYTSILAYPLPEGALSAYAEAYAFIDIYVQKNDLAKMFDAVLSGTLATDIDSDLEAPGRMEILNPCFDIAIHGSFDGSTLGFNPEVAVLEVLGHYAATLPQYDNLLDDIIRAKYPSGDNRRDLEKYFGL